MEIISKPTSYSFAGNVLDIIVKTQSAVAFKLSLNDTPLLDERYDPIEGVVTIKLRELLERITPKAPIEAGSVPLSLYKYSVDNEAGDFYCVCGGHGASSDAASFMRSNWLTWQPQSRTTTFHAPQRLVYAAVSAVDVKVKAYFSDNTTHEITLVSLDRGFVHTIDVTFGAIYSRFEKHPISFDIWVDGNQIKSYVQRYYLSNESADADFFMWYNSVGGVDTVEFDGERGEENKVDSLSAIFGQDELEFDCESRKVFTKYTGYIEKENTRLWVLDFFNSTHRFHIDQGAVRRIVVSDPKLKHTRGTLAGFEFDYAYSVQSPYLNLPRRDVPEILEIVAPDDSLFF